MAAIPGWVYILVGAVVAGFSAYTRERTGSQVMLFFFIVGFVFIVIGVLKIAWGYWSGRSQYGKADISGLEKQEARREAVRAQQATQAAQQDSRKLEVEPEEIDMPLDPSRSQALNKMYSQQAQ